MSNKYALARAPERGRRRLALPFAASRPDEIVAKE